MNVAVAASIVLHHYALWAGYTERERQGQKYVVGERPEQRGPRGRVPLTADEAAALRAARSAAAAAASDSEGEGEGLQALFDGGGGGLID